MTYDEILSLHYAGKNFTVPWRDMVLAKSPHGMWALYYSEGRQLAFGCPALKRAGTYLIFVKCEHCGNNQLDNEDRCTKCRKEP